jgi:hypothetical protein
MPTIELIYDHNCPNVDAARRLLEKAFSEFGRAPSWREWEQHDRTAPAYAQEYGSPTILVNGKDIANNEPAKTDGMCRVYRNPDGTFSGIPPLERIMHALEPIAQHWPKRKKGIFALLSGSISWLVVLAPKAACPA